MRCLRKIYNISHAYYSRISNQEVLDMAGQEPLSTTLLQRQLKLFGEVTRRDDNDPARVSIFEPGQTKPRRWPGVRRQGRLRQHWADTIHAHAVAAAGGQEALDRAVSCRTDWCAAVGRYCVNRSAGAVHGHG